MTMTRNAIYLAVTVLVLTSLFLISSYASTEWHRWMLFLATIGTLGPVAICHLYERERSR